MAEEWYLPVNGDFQASVQGFARIVELFGKQYESKITPIGISGISFTGLICTSNLRLPKNDTIIWQFQIEVADMAIILLGTIRECLQLTDDTYEYVVRWATERPTREGVRYLYDKLNTEYRYFKKYAMQMKPFDMLG
jgi:hypothetical protein